MRRARCLLLSLLLLVTPAAYGLISNSAEALHEDGDTHHRLIKDATQDGTEVLTKHQGQIRFAQGHSSTTIKGRVAKNTRDEYVLRARAGQVMSVRLASADPQMAFDVYVTRGLEALPVTPENEPPRGEWSGILPKGDEYYVIVYSTGDGGEYSFLIQIESAQPRKREDESSAREAPQAGVAEAFRLVLPQLKKEARAPVLLPSELTTPLANRRIFVTGGGEPNGYVITLASTPECGANACTIGFFEAKRGERLAYRLNRELEEGIRGYYKLETCGGSCAPPEIGWVYKGVLYIIQLKVNSGSARGDETELMKLARSAIGAGER